MKFGLGVNANETTREIVKKSIEAERLGIDYVWIADVPVQLYAPTVASAIAANTRKIQIGVGLLSTFLYAPNHIANSFATLIEAYGERFELLIGPGDKDQLKRVGLSMAHPVPDYILKSKHQIEKTLSKNTVKGRIWLGAQGPKMLKIAKFFDGVLLNYAHPNLVKWAINKIGRVKTKRFQFGVFAPSYVYSDFDQNVHGFLRISSAVVALGAPRTILKRIGLHEKIVEAKKKLDSGLAIKSILDDIPLKTVEFFSIFKPSSQLGTYLSELSKMKVEHMVFSYPQNFSEKTIKELAQALKSIKEQ